MKAAAHQYEDKLLELAYGELPAHEATAVESHVRGCTRCSEALSEIRAVRSTMGQLPAVEPPAAGLESLYAYAEQAARRTAAGPAPQATWWKRYLAPLVLASALGVVAVVGFQVKKSPDGGELPRRDQLVVDAQKKEAAAAPTSPAAPAAVAVAPTPVANAEPNAEPEPAPAELKGSMPSFGQERDSYAGARDELAKLEEKPAEKRKATRAVPMPKTVSKAAPAKEAELADLVQTANKLDEAKTGKKDSPAPPSSMNAWPQDYEKHGRDNAMVPKGEAVAAANEKAPSDKNVAFGLKAGDTANAPRQAFEQPPAPAPVAQAAPAPVVAPSPQMAAAGPGSGGGGKRGGVTTEEAQKPKAPPPPPLADAPSSPYQSQAMPRSSMGVFDRKAKQQEQQQLAQREDRRAADDNDGFAAAKQVSQNAEGDKKRVVYELDAMLRQARNAELQSDAKSEARLAMEILSHEPRGQQRMEALAYACRALQMLGQVDQATRYCSSLSNEFPGNEVGRQWAENQNQRRERSAPSPAKRAKQGYDYEDAAEASQKAAEPPAAPTLAK